jgi:hypothetical protein
MSIVLPPSPREHEPLERLRHMANRLEADPGNHEPTVDRIERILDGLRWHLNSGLAIFRVFAEVMQEPRTDGVKLRAAFGILTPGDLSTLIGKDETTLANWRARNCGPDYVKLGRAVFYRREDVEAWIALNVMPTDRSAA